MGVRAIKQNERFVRDESLDFSDDGNRFRGYRYRGLPCSYLRKYGEIYLRLRPSYKHFNNAPDGFDRWFHTNIGYKFYNESANGIAEERFNQSEWEKKNDEIILRIRDMIEGTGKSDWLEFFDKMVSYPGSKVQQMITHNALSDEKEDLLRIKQYPYSTDNDFKIISILKKCSPQNMARRARVCWDWNCENNYQVIASDSMKNALRRDLEKLLTKAGLDPDKILDD